MGDRGTFTIHIFPAISVLTRPFKTLESCSASPTPPLRYSIIFTDPTRLVQLSVSLLTQAASPSPVNAYISQTPSSHFGNAGRLPLTFKHSEGQSIDVGSVRIFLFMHNVDLFGIAQQPIVERERAKGVVSPCRWTSELEMWDAIILPVVMV